MHTGIKVVALIFAAAHIMGMPLAGAWGQQAGSQGGCTDATKTTTTQIEKGPDSGSKNMGSTGWGGGMREPKSGSPSDKKLSESSKDQSATAKGLDPTKQDSSGPC